MIEGGEIPLIAGTGATATPRTTSYVYDGNGNQTSVTDPRGYVTKTTYNAGDAPTMETDPTSTRL